MKNNNDNEPKDEHWEKEGFKELESKHSHFFQTMNKSLEDVKDLEDGVMDLETCVIKESEANEVLARMFPKRRWNNFVYWPFRIWYRIEEYFNEVKWFIQRGKRGYSDNDVYNFDYYISDIISKGLRQLAKNIDGYPSDFTNDVAWKFALESMASAFEYENAQSDGYCIIPKNKKERQRLDKLPVGNFPSAFIILDEESVRKYKEGWNLFRKYFSSLND